LNYLAHFHLAWPEPGLLAGALEGDYFKGPLPGTLAPGIERGVRLHRAIDAFSDRDPRLRSLRAHFPPDLRRYAGILIDLSFDHFLCLYWPDFCELSRPEFNREVYRNLRAQRALLSPACRAMSQRMEDADLLDRYAQWDFISASAARVGSRFRRGNPLLDCARRLSPLHGELERAFTDFYPQLVEFARTGQGR